jgi:ATP-dependent DNA helicase RecG
VHGKMLPAEASVMVVEHAERFGLSQLHQLRGRVGRGETTSWCVIVSGSDPSPEAENRLRLFTRTTNGIELAQRDLELRGPGEFRGTRQSGVPDLRNADLVRDLDLLEKARQEVRSCRLNSPLAAAPPPISTLPRTPGPGRVHSRLRGPK